MSLPRIYTVSDVLEVLPLSRNTLYGALISGELKATKCGGKWLVTETAIEAFLGLETVRADEVALTDSDEFENVTAMRGRSVHVPR